MVDVTLWELAQAIGFIGVDAATFEALSTQYKLRIDRNGHYVAQDVVGLSEKLATIEHGLTPGWRGAFYRDGFAELPALISDEQMSLVDSWARGRLAARDDQSHGVEATYASTGQLVRVNFLERDPGSVALVSQLPFANAARELLNDAVMYRLSVVIRSFSTPPELGRHRDPRWVCRRLSMPVFAFGLHLDSTTGEIGDVYYSPGTQAIGDDGVLRDAQDPALPERTISTERGDVVVHNLGVVHGAHPYEADRLRVTIYCSFASAREVALQKWGPQQ